MGRWINRIASSVVGALVGAVAMNGSPSANAAPPSAGQGAQPSVGFSQRLDAAREMAASLHLDAGASHITDSFTDSFADTFGDTFKDSFSRVYSGV